MANFTSLNFHIFSRYHGEGADRARRDMRNMDNTLTRHGVVMNRITEINRRNEVGMNRAASAIRRWGEESKKAEKHTRGLTMAMALTAPAIGPIGGMALAAGGALLGMGAAAGLAAGIYGFAMANAVKSTLKMAKHHQQLSKSQKDFVNTWKRLSKEYNKATRDISLQPLTIVMKGAIRGMGQLKSIMKATTPVMNEVARALARWLGGSGFARFAMIIRDYGVPALLHLERAGRHALTFLGFGFRAAAPWGLKLAEAIERGAKSLAHWARGGGFVVFIGYVRANGPLIKSFFHALWAAVKQLAVATRGVGPIYLRLVTIFLQLIAHTPVPILRALIVVMILNRTAVGATVLRWIAAKIALLGLRAASFLAAFAMSTLRSRMFAVGNSALVLRVRLALLAAWERIHAAAARVGATALNFLRLSSLRAGASLLFLRIRLLLIRAAQLAAAGASRVGAAAMSLFRARSLSAGAAALVARARVLAARVAMLLTRGATIAASAAMSLFRARTWSAGAAAIVARARVMAARAAMLLSRGATLAAGAAMNVFRARVWSAGAASLLARARILAVRSAMFLARSAAFLAGAAMNLLRARIWAAGATAILARARLYAVRAAMIAVAVGAKIARGAMIAFRLALFLVSSHPIVLAIVAIVAAIVFLATKTKFFQKVWHAVWMAVRAVIHFVWVGIRAVFNFYVFYYTKALPAAARFVWKAITAAWHAIWGGIKSVYSWLARNVFGPIVHWFGTFIPKAARFLGHIIVSVFSAIGHGLNVAYRWTVRNILAPIVHWFTNSLPKAGKFLGHVIVNTFSAIGHGISVAYHWMVRNIFNPIGHWFTKTIPAFAKTLWHGLTWTFGKIRDGIKFIWEKLKGILKAPIKWFVDVVYNHGIVPTWNNTIGKIPGVPNLHAMKLATGGPVRGPGGPTGDKIPAMLSDGEFVINSHSAKRLGLSKLYQLNAYGKGGMVSPMNYLEAGGPPTPPPPTPGTVGPGGTSPSDPGQANRGKGPIKVGGIKVSTIFKKGFNWATDFFADVAGEAIKWFLKPFRWAVNHTTAKFGATNANKGKLGGAPAWAIRGSANAAFDAITDFLMSKAQATGNGYIAWPPWKAGDGAHTTWKGKPVNKRTAAMLNNAQKLFKKSVAIYQGSWSHAAASAGTHSGGGAADVGPAVDPLVGAMRASGFAAWRRTREEGFAPHIHAIAVGDPTASPAAKQQVKDFFKGLNGLANHGPDTYHAGGGAAKQIAKAMLGRFGWGQSQFPALDKLWQHESGWNPHAKNPSSGAYGIPQALPASKMASAGPDWKNNPATQIAWGLQYIKGRYGSPNGAWGFWQKHHWYGKGGPVMANSYDHGGMLPEGLSLINNSTGRPEPVGYMGDIHIHGNVYTKSEREFRDMVIRTLEEARRRRRA